MNMHPRLLAAALLALAGCATQAPAPAPPADPGPVAVKIIAFNDFHGNLRTPGLRVPVPDATASTGFRMELAGGIEQFAAKAKALRAGAKHSILVSAGDMVGATPLLSAFFRDEPTIEAMNLAGVDLNAVGNHEFDYGVEHLKRLQKGGCVERNGKPDCADRGDRGPYAGARFGFLAANVIEQATGKPLFPPYAIREFDGVKLAFIGLVLKNTPLIVRPNGTVGLTFKDEADTVRALVPELAAQDVKSAVVVMHEGIGIRPGGLSDCNLPEGDPRDRLAQPAMKGKTVADAFDPMVQLVITGHTHRYYVCESNGRLITSAGSNGIALTEIDVAFDRLSGRMVSSRAVNHRVDPAGPKDPALTPLLNAYVAMAEPLENRVVARFTMELPPIANAAGESALGNLVADAHLAASAAPDKGGAVIAFNNPRSLRAALIPQPDGGIRYGDLFKAQPFQNDLVLMNLTGRQIKDILEQQFTGAGILNISAGFTYTWDNARPAGQKVLAESILLNGTAVQSDLQYRVVANAFLAAGSEGMAAFAQGTDRQVGVLDLEALVGYLSAAGTYTPPPMGRIKRLN
ncbi:MAG: bifunctional metallophosphatase/5'-nucleotidase [Betaproteobacteria bacterium]|nr:bifunctional metallophosphatase/5'-nucleotidase [Betaproteobacteria bacterium]